MPPRVFSSVKEAWAGVLSGAVPITRRRVSCSTIDALPREGDSNSSRVASASSKKDFPQTETQASTSEESYDESDEEPFECRVFVQLSDDKDKDKDQVDIGALSDEDLQRLKRDDPFLYYSIPSIRRRSYRFDADEDEDENADVIRMAMTRTPTRRRTSLPAQVLANADISRSQQQREARRSEEVLTVIEEPSRRGSVTRCRRLSTEAHPMLICDDLLRELEDLDVEDEDDIDLALLERELSGI